MFWIHALPHGTDLDQCPASWSTMGLSGYLGHCPGPHHQNLRSTLGPSKVLVISVGCHQVGHVSRKEPHCYSGCSVMDAIWNVTAYVLYFSYQTGCPLSPTYTLGYKAIFPTFFIFLFQASFKTYIYIHTYFFFLKITFVLKLHFFFYLFEEQGGECHSILVEVGGQFAGPSSTMWVQEIKLKFVRLGNMCLNLMSHLASHQHFYFFTSIQMFLQCFFSPKSIEFCINSH